jgi:thioredoxin-related protein
MKLKSITVLILAVQFFNTIKAQESPIPAGQVLTNAFEEAKQTNKNVFILFKASWCGWCKKMDASMKDEKTKNLFNSNYVIKHLVVKEAQNKKHIENKGSDKILTNFGGAKSGIPYWLIFDKNGTLLADSKMVEGKLVLKEKGNNIGCPGSKEEVEAFTYKLKETSNLTDEELAIITKRFRKNSTH